MRKIDKLLLKATVPPFIVALIVLTFVIFVHDLGRLSELLITHNASLPVIASMALTILPGILIFSLPLSYLVGLLIGLSGLSGESQITALRACGVPLRKMLAPILILAGLVGCLTAVMSMFVLPETNDALRALKDRISMRQVTAQVRPRIFNEEFPNVVFYLDDLSVDRQNWSRVFLVDSSNPKSPRTVLARHGTWITDQATERLQLHLETGTIYEVDPDDASRDNVSLFAATDIPIDFAHGPTADNETTTKPKRPAEQSTRELWNGNPQSSPEDRREQRIELHRRIAIPFSVLPFSLLGLTLGISTKKGGRTSGFVLSMVLVLLFYVLFFNGVRLASVGKFSPWLGAWEANLSLMVIGLALLVVSERATPLGGIMAGWKSGIGLSGKKLPLEIFRSGSRKIDRFIASSTRKIARFRFPKVLDLYVSRGFLVHFLWSILVCSTLFIVLTLFELLDDIIRNRIPITYVADYFLFLTPQILMLVVPMSVLLAILINFGILEKNSEVTALKAGGWSLYRIAMPVFMIAALFCLSMYMMQDYVVPYANIRQDALRNIIKGRPAQTSMRPQRKWIFGESNRIFNYDYFDASRDLFIGLNVFEIDFGNLTILRRIHASRAKIGQTGTWELEDGWVRNFQPGYTGYEHISKATFNFPEKTSYFEKEIFEPKESSKLTYLELKNYIKYLRQSGYNATELQVELYKKISFPLSCVVMALIGVPFSFSTGRKGAFFGISASVAIAISYWGIYSVFEQMGAYGLLIPLLAAWAPNILFGAAGLAMFFTIRT